jgi:hypothetical protein
VKGKEIGGEVAWRDGAVKGSDDVYALLHISLSPRIK